MKPILSLLLLITASANAAPVTLAWNPNPDHVTAYRVHVGTTSRIYSTNYLAGGCCDRIEEDRREEEIDYEQDL